MLRFRWEQISLEVSEEGEGFRAPYATFVVDEYYFLDVGPNDVVVDAGAYVGDSAVKAAARAGLVIAVELNPRSVELLAITNKPVFVVEGSPWYSWALRKLGVERYHEAFGDRSRVERFFGALKRGTRISFNNVNARRPKIASLDRMMNMFFAYYNGPRFQEGIGRVPSEVIPLI